MTVIDYGGILVSEPDCSNYNGSMPSLLNLPGPLFAISNYLRNWIARARDKRDLRAERDIMDGLRHADYNSHKYIVSLFMKSGRTIVGRIGDGAYVHASYDKHRGILRVIPEREYPEGVSYEYCDVKLSEIEGYLLQDVNRASPQQMKRLREENELSSDIGTAA